jgi:ankyrin repeat protein
MEKRLSVFASRKKREEAKQHDIEVQLRQACSHEPPSLEVIQALVAQYPSALKSKDEDGERPLHLACWKGASLEVVQFLVHSWPYGVRAKQTVSGCRFTIPVLEKDLWRSFNILSANGLIPFRKETIVVGFLFTWPVSLAPRCLRFHF